MSIERSLSDAERAALLDEVREHLPAFLSGKASERRDAAGDVRELLHLEPGDLERVVAVHLCLDEAVQAFGAALPEVLRQPLPGKLARPEVSRAVRGPVDWAKTAKRRALAPGEATTFVVPGAGATVDTAENRAVAWLLRTLARSVETATAWRPSKPEAGPPDLAWQQKIDFLRMRLREARELPWLRSVAPARPSADTIRRLRRARLGAYAQLVAAAVDSVLRLTDYSPKTLTEALASRYFRPEGDGTLFEVAVALRLARAFEKTGQRRLSRLLMGDGRSSFARFELADGAEIQLAYQAWPDDQKTLRLCLLERHGVANSRDRVPDIIIVRSEPQPDAVILELKASHKAGYLREGLTELAAYLADRPDLWGNQPAGWLVVPDAAPFDAADADTGFPLWLLSADQIADAALARFAPAEAG